MAKPIFPIYERLLKEVQKAGLVFNRNVSSFEWFKGKLSNFENYPQNLKALEHYYNKDVPPGEPGEMYLFQYDPKYKNTLKYYDEFPLVLVIGSHPKGFIGLNFHYLPLVERAILFEALLALETKDKNDFPDKIEASYDILVSAYRYKYFRPCIKKYLWSHVGKIFTRILPHEREMVLFLPLHQFAKEKDTTVWQESVDKIKKRK